MLRRPKHKAKRRRLQVLRERKGILLNSDIVTSLKSSLESDLRRLNVCLQLKQLSNGNHAVYLRPAGGRKHGLTQAWELVRRAATVLIKSGRKNNNFESSKKKEDLSDHSEMGEDLPASTSKETPKSTVDITEEVLELPRIEVDLKNLDGLKQPGGTPVLNGQFIRFLKNTLQQGLRDKLNVDMESVAQERGHHKLYLVRSGEEPKFEEALELVRKAVIMSQESFRKIQTTTDGSPKKEEDKPITILDESFNMEDNSEAHTSKENPNSRSEKEQGDTTITILDESCYVEEKTEVRTSKKRSYLDAVSDISEDEGTSEKGLLRSRSRREQTEDTSIVVLDDEKNSGPGTSKETSKKTSNSTAGSPEESRSEEVDLSKLVWFSNGTRSKRRSRIGRQPPGGPESGPTSYTVSASAHLTARDGEKRPDTEHALSDESCSKETSGSGSSREKLQPASTSEDFIPLNHYTRLARMKGELSDTRSQGDETILISSGDESEDDIKIERVVRNSPASASPKRVKKKGQKRSLSAGSLGGYKVINGKLTKIKSRNTQSPLLRSPKVSKKCENTDVSSSTVGAAPKSRLVADRFRGVPLVRHPCQRSPQGVARKTKLGTASNSQSKTLAARNGQGPSQGPSTSASTSGSQYNFDNNIIALGDKPPKLIGLRPAIIDARNVASDKGRFNFSKMEICIKYFRDRNHKVIALLPRHIQGHIHGTDREKMDKLEEEEILCFTPSRRIPGGKSYASYDDRYIVQVAHRLGGVIVSNDNYRDIMTEHPDWKETIENRLLMFTWVGDMLMFPNDPLGRDGPHLEEFLRFPKDGEEQPSS